MLSVGANPCRTSSLAHAGYVVLFMRLANKCGVQLYHVITMVLLTQYCLLPIANETIHGRIHTLCMPPWAASSRSSIPRSRYYRSTGRRNSRSRRAASAGSWNMRCTSSPTSRRMRLRIAARLTRVSRRCLSRRYCSSAHRVCAGGARSYEPRFSRRRHLSMRCAKPVDATDLTVIMGVGV